MSLETSTFISGLTETWPVAGDTKSQGDDHLRLLKSVLKSTFPVANRAFYFPTTELAAGAMVLDPTDQNNFIGIDTTAGNIAVTLPATLAVGDRGWSCEIMKYSGDANAVIVSPAAGLITSRVGNTATIRIGVMVEPARFVWSGGGWWCAKPGALIGSTANFDGATVPPGYLVNDGAAYNTTNFAELFAVLGSGVVRDKRGRVEAGVDNGAVNRLTSSFFGVASAAGAVGGAESLALTIANMAAHDHGGLTGAMSANASHSHSTLDVLNGGSVGSGPSGPGAQPAGGPNGVTNATDINHLHSISSQGSGTAHRTVQPTIIVQKLLRAC